MVSGYSNVCTVIERLTTVDRCMSIVFFNIQITLAIISIKIAGALIKTRRDQAVNISKIIE